MNKKCIDCLETKPISDFTKDKYRPDGLNVYCTACKKERSKKTREKEGYKEKVSLSRKDWLKRNPHKKEEYARVKKEQRRLGLLPSYLEYVKKTPIEKLIITQAKARAKHKGLEFNLEEKDIVVPTHCPALGMEICSNSRIFGKSGKKQDNSISIDRIDNTKGYIKGNVVIVSNKVNTVKNSATVEELEKITNFYKGLKSKTDG